MFAHLCHTVAAYSQWGTKTSMNDFILWSDRASRALPEQTEEEALAVMKKAAAIVKKRTANVK